MLTIEGMRGSQPEDGQNLLLDQQQALAPFKANRWLELTPAERLARAWAMRSRLADPQSAHDQKLFPAP